MLGLKPTTYFEGIPVYTSRIGSLKHGAAMAWPGVGLFVNPMDVNNIGLLRHEFGHILQVKKWGAAFFYKSIAPTSLRSANRSNKNPDFDHDATWTEWSANYLSYNYFSKPADWDFGCYPIEPPPYEREWVQLPDSIRLS